jgi:4-oxalocrotonate tautomerase
MPITTIKTIKGALTDNQKRALHQKIADVMVEIEGRGNEALRKFVIVSIEEVEPINMGIGGKAADADFVKKITGR